MFLILFCALLYLPRLLLRIVGCESILLYPKTLAISSIRSISLSISSNLKEGTIASILFLFILFFIFNELSISETFLMPISFPRIRFIL
jgi:hypothetical protein